MVSESIVAIVVSYNSASTLEACLTSLLRAKGIAQVRVVDNGSADTSVAIAQRFAVADARVRFIANADNPGFAAANNQGVAMSDAPWLAFINPDVRVEENTLATLAAHGETVGPCLLGVRQVDENGVPDPAVRRRDPDFAAMVRQPWRGMSLAVPENAEQTWQMVQALSGAVMVIPRRLFERLGGWDAGYRLHVEDLDLCRRARLAGATVAIANHLQVVHVRGVSSRSRPLYVEWQKHRGLWRYYRLYEAPSGGLALSILVWMGIWLHAGFRLVRVLLAP